METQQVIVRCDHPGTTRIDTSKPKLVNLATSAGRKIQWNNTHTLFRGLWAQEETDVGKKCVFNLRQAGFVLPETSLRWVNPLVL